MFFTLKNKYSNLFQKRLIQFKSDRLIENLPSHYHHHHDPTNLSIILFIKICSSSYLMSIVRSLSWSLWASKFFSPNTKLKNIPPWSFKLRTLNYLSSACTYSAVCTSSSFFFFVKFHCKEIKMNISQLLIKSLELVWLVAWQQ